jgi:predicted PurR-regulated permease PerM
MLGVLLPTAALGLMAASEAATLTKNMNRDDLMKKISTLQNRLSLGPPPAVVVQSLEQLRQTLDQLDEVPMLPRIGGGDAPPVEIPKLFEKLQAESKKIEEALSLPSVEGTDAPPVEGDKAAPSKQLVAAWLRWKTEIGKTKPLPTDVAAWNQAWAGARAALNQFNGDLYGGPIAAWFKQNVNVEPDMLQNVLDRVRTSLGPLALGTTQFIISLTLQLTIGLAVMLLATYYFLADGRAMVASTMRLTPIDNNYLEQLGQEFANLTRAIVLSMLLSSVAQGMLALPAFYFAGFHSVFLLTLATMICAMVPFVGSTIVWIPCGLWIAFFEGQIVPALVFAAYFIVVVGLSDNLIKPLVLHGRTSLHPLPALLSVIGGVEALGPIGVFVGPMVVALMHTLLVMLRRELNRLDGKPTFIPPST